MIRIKLLGKFEIWLEKKQLSHQDLPRQKTLTLLKILATQRGQSWSQDQLLEILFPEQDPQKAINNLYGRISELRKLLEPHLKRGNQSQYILRLQSGYGFNKEAECFLDTEAFLEQSELGQAAQQNNQWIQAQTHYEQALKLYEGDFLIEDLYEHWTQSLRQQWKEHYVELLDQLGQCHAQLGNLDHAIGYCEQALGAYPQRESLYRQLMQYHYHSGNQDLATQTYQDCVNVLDELDTVPSPETDELYLKISKHELPQVQKAAPHNLPLELTSFIGREIQLADVKAQLLQARLLTLTGIGGAGKTRLALRSAHEVLNTFEDGVWLVELAGLSSESMVSQAVVGALGIQDKSNRSPDEVLREFLQSKQMLLLLDNCEHVIHACASLAEILLQHCPQLTILTTSREPLNINGEHTYVVPPMTLPQDVQSLSVAELKSFESVQLFAERAATARDSFVLSQRNAMQVAEVCKRLDGIPLAIELAAVRIKVLSVAQLAKRLSKRFKLLTRGSRTAQARQQTLHAMIDWSFDLLTPQQRTLFRRLSVFAGSFDLDGVDHVCLGQDLETFEAIDLLSELVDKSLVVVERHPELGVRYRLLETVKDFGNFKLYEAEEVKPFQEHHFVHYLQVAQQADMAIEGPDPAPWFECLEVEHNNFRTALAWCVESQKETLGLQLANALSLFWNIRSHWTEARDWFERLLLCTDALGHTSERAAALSKVGFITLQLGNPRKAREQIELSLEMCDTLDDTHIKAHGLKQLASVKLYEGDFPKAIELCRQSQALYQQIDDKLGEGNLLRNLGLMYWNTDEYDLTLNSYEASLDMLRNLCSKMNVGMCLQNLGLMLYKMGDYHLSLNYSQEAQQIFIELQDNVHLAEVLHNIGGIHEALAVGGRQGLFWPEDGLVADVNKSMTRYKRAHDIFKNIGYKTGEVILLNDLAFASIIQADYMSAMNYLRDSIALSHELGWNQYLIKSLSIKSRLYCSLKQRDDALDAANQAMQLLETNPIPEAEEIYFAHYHVLSACGQADGVRGYLKLAYQKVMEKGSKIKSERLKSCFLQSCHNLIAAWDHQ